MPGWWMQWKEHHHDRDSHRFPRHIVNNWMEGMEDEWANVNTGWKVKWFDFVTDKTDSLCGTTWIGLVSLLCHTKCALLYLSNCGKKIGQKGIAIVDQLEAWGWVFGHFPDFFYTKKAWLFLTRACLLVYQGDVNSNVTMLKQKKMATSLNVSGLLPWSVSSGYFWRAFFDEWLGA